MRNEKELPMSVVNRIIFRLKTLYGSKFVDAWDCVTPAEMAKAWAEGLAGMSTDELKRGIDECMKRPFPPTLPEFRLLCTQHGARQDEMKRQTPEERAAEYAQCREAAVRHLPNLMENVQKLAEKRRMQA
jgi:hypothetical protein